MGKIKGTGLTKTVYNNKTSNTSNKTSSYSSKGTSVNSNGGIDWGSSLNNPANARLVINSSNPNETAAQIKSGKTANQVYSNNYSYAGSNGVYSNAAAIAEAAAAKAKAEAEAKKKAQEIADANYVGSGIKSIQDSLTPTTTAKLDESVGTSFWDNVKNLFSSKDTAVGGSTANDTVLNNADNTVSKLQQKSYLGNILRSRIDENEPAGTEAFDKLYDIAHAKERAAISQGLDDATYALKAANTDAAGTSRIQNYYKDAIDKAEKDTTGYFNDNADAKTAYITDLTNKLTAAQNYAANNGWNNQATYDAAALNGLLNPTQQYTSNYMNTIKGISNMATSNDLATTPLTAAEASDAYNILKASGAITKDAQTGITDINQDLVPTTEVLLGQADADTGGSTAKERESYYDTSSSGMGYSLEDALATTRQAINDQLTSMYGEVPTLASVLNTYNDYFNSTGALVDQTNNDLLNQLYDSQGSTMANLAKVLRSNRQSGLTSGANTGATAAANALSAQSIANEQATAQQTAWNNILSNLLTYRQKQNDIPGNAYSTISSLANAITEALGNTAGYDLYGDIAAYRNNT